MFPKWWLLIGALLLTAAAGWFALSLVRQGAPLEQTQGSGQKVAGLPQSGALLTALFWSNRTAGNPSQAKPRHSVNG